jgi:class 3 adenylate cyclase
MDRMATAPLAAGSGASEGDTIATLHHFALDLAGHPDLNEILRNALLAATRLSGSQHATVLLIDEQSEHIRYRVALDSGNLAPLELIAKPMMSKGLAGWVARERRTALVPDTEHDPRWLPGPGLGDLRSAIVAPLIYGDRTLGVMTLGHESPGHYTDEHLRLVELLCAPVALAIDHARLSASLTGEHDPRLAPAEISSPQSSAWPAAERPIACDVVALSAELHGLIAATAKLTPEALFDDVLNVYFTAMDRIIRSHAGAVDTIAGDTLLAIFRRAEQTPAKAVRAALEMREAAQRLSAHWRTHLRLNAGTLDIGIARGPAVIGGIGVSHNASHAVGDVIGEAARLRELARTGEILVSSAVAEGLDSSAAPTVEPLQPLRLRDGVTRQIFRIYE